MSITRRCVCPGSFDPVTNGHLDVISRAHALYDEVVVAVGVNLGKNGMFDLGERVDMLREALATLAGVEVVPFEGLLVDFCRARDIPVVLKGLRAAGDFDYELAMAQMNRRLSGLETVFVPTHPGHAYLSSSLVKEVAKLGGDVAGMVPDAVLARLRSRLGADPADPLR